MEHNEYIKRIHEEILKVMDEIDRICRDQGLQYYLIGGTLLGAVRHGGFIPWDDDLDIAMPREDYETFLAICPSVLPPYLKIGSARYDSNYHRLFSKVYNVNTRFVEHVGEKETNMGIFVDIFPLDLSDGYSKSLERRKWFVKKCSVMLSSKAYPGQLHGIKKIIVNSLSSKKILRMAEYVMQHPKSKNKKFTSNFTSHYDIKRQTMLSEYFGRGRVLSFNGREYMVPSDYKAVLTSIFGKNYMQVPPKEKQITHHPSLVKFSDGTEAKFS
ncbi:MAG: LicD family protein [Prevotella sp.]|nr:LicD family protein [Prevotella sp.]